MNSFHREVAQYHAPTSPLCWLQIPLSSFTMGRAWSVRSATSCTPCRMNRFLGGCLCEWSALPFQRRREGYLHPPSRCLRSTESGDSTYSLHLRCKLLVRNRRRSKLKLSSRNGLLSYSQCQSQASAWWAMVLSRPSHFDQSSTCHTRCCSRSCPLHRLRPSCSHWLVCVRLVASIRGLADFWTLGTSRVVLLQHLMDSLLSDLLFQVEHRIQMAQWLLYRSSRILDKVLIRLLVVHSRICSSVPCSLWSFSRQGLRLDSRSFHLDSRSFHLDSRSCHLSCQLSSLTQYPSLPLYSLWCQLSHLLGGPRCSLQFRG